MTYDSSVSPVGWYVGTYQLRFIELTRSGNDDPERKFLTWENTVLVRAGSIDEAYDKVVAIGIEATEPYKGGLEGVDVQWVFEGIIDLLPVYEELQDGAEIMWGECTKKLKNLRARVKSKEMFHENQQQAQQSAPVDAESAVQPRRDRVQTLEQKDG